MVKRTAAMLVLGGLIASPAFSQTPPNPTQQGIVRPTGDAPVFRVSIVGRTTSAINYRPRKAETKIDFAGTQLMPGARGSATIEGEKGYIQVKAHFDKLVPPGQF